MQQRISAAARLPDNVEMPGAETQRHGTEVGEMDDDVEYRYVAFGGRLRRPGV